MLWAHFGQCYEPILGLGLGSLQPTTDLYGLLVVKQDDNWREWVGLITARETMGVWFPCWWRGFWCWRGRNPGGSNVERGMSIKGERIGEQRTFWHFWEREYFVGEKNRGWGAFFSELRAWRKASTLWFFEEESYRISVSGSNHERTWIIFGGDSDVLGETIVQQNRRHPTAWTNNINE